MLTHLNAGLPITCGHKLFVFHAVTQYTDSRGQQIDAHLVFDPLAYLSAERGDYPAEPPLEMKVISSWPLHLINGMQFKPDSIVIINWRDLKPDIGFFWHRCRLLGDVVHRNNHVLEAWRQINMGVNLYYNYVNAEGRKKYEHRHTQ
jgi:hypothetical protein